MAESKGIKIDPFSSELCGFSPSFGPLAHTGLAFACGMGQGPPFIGLAPRTEGMGLALSERSQRPWGSRLATDPRGLPPAQRPVFMLKSGCFIPSFAAHFKVENCNPPHILCCSFLGYLATRGTTLYCAHFSYEKVEKARDTLPPGAAQLVTAGVGTSKAAGDEGAGPGARPGSVGPGAPLGTASPQLWAPRAEAKGTAGRHPSLPRRLQPWPQAWEHLDQGPSGRARLSLKGWCQEPRTLV